jgi:hypothetical protein
MGYRRWSSWERQTARSAPGSAILDVRPGISDAQHRHRPGAPALIGPEAIASFRTEYGENTFPALSVRAGENAFGWFSDHESSDIAPESVSSTERLRLSPTARSMLR